MIRTQDAPIRGTANVLRYKSNRTDNTKHTLQCGEETITISQRNSDQNLSKILVQLVHINRMSYNVVITHLHKT